jgi:hypothetical protein
MAPTWGHVLTVECMRTTTSPGRPVPAKNQTKGSKHLGWCYHPLSIYIYKSKIKTNLEKKKIDIFSKISKLNMKSICK